jgi:hypothetical protein
MGARVVTLDLETDKGTKKRQFVPGAKDRKPEEIADLKKRHAQALDYFKASATYFAQQRKRETDDLKFVDFGEQWDPTVKTQRAGNQATNDLPPTPPRPTPVINQLIGAGNQLANTRRAARLSLTFSPKGGGASQDTADIFEDIVRAAQEESRAQIARNWAADRAEKCGLGWYRIDTDYAEEDPTDAASWNDQDLVWRRILNQASVYPDPSAQEPDFSDGRHWFVTEDIPLREYRAMYPDSDLSDFDDSELSAIGDPHGLSIGVITTSEEGDVGKTVRVAEYWELVDRERTKVMLTDGTSAFDDEELPEGVQVATGPEARKRRMRDRKLVWSKINAIEYLEAPRPWNGKFCPLIPTIGNEFNVAGERRWGGYVGPGKDANVIYNVMNASRLETIGLATKAPYIGYFETIEPYLEWWKQSAVRNFFMLPIKAVKDAAGNFLPPPKRNVEEPAIQAISLAAQSAKDDVHTTTGIPPVALGQLDPHDRSGTAIQALQGQAEVGGSGYLDNFVNITLHYDGKVVRDLIPRIFDRPGRIVPAVGLDEKRRMVMLNYPYVEGPDGTPLKALPNWEKGQPIPKEISGPPGQDGKPQTLEVKYYDLSQGSFSTAPTVGKSFATKREAVNDAIQNIMKVVPPEMAAVLAPAFIESLDTPDSRKLADIAKKALPPQLASAYDDGSDGPSPEVQQLQQQVQQLQQQLQSKVAEKQAEQQAKGQMDLQKTQLQEQFETQRAQQENQVQIAKAEIAANASIAVAELKNQNDDLTRRLKLVELYLTAQQEHRLDQEAHIKDVTAQALDHGHEAVQSALDRQHEKDLASQQHAQALEQGQQQAALQAPQEPSA